MIVITLLYVNITDTEKAVCSMPSKVKTVMLRILLKSIKGIATLSKEEKARISKVMNKFSMKKKKSIKGRKVRKTVIKKSRINNPHYKSYMKTILGKIPAKHFDRLFNIYDTEQQDLEKQIQYFENEIESYHQRKVDTDKFLKY